MKNILKGGKKHWTWNSLNSKILDEVYFKMTNISL